jgi:hypothetical protein
VTAAPLPDDPNRILVTARGVAKLVLGAIEHPAETNDSGAKGRQSAIELLTAAGISATDGQAMLNAWLDGGDREVLLEHMTAGLKALHAQGHFRRT